MAQPVPPPSPIATVGAPVTVLGQEFVAPYPIDLAIVRKVMTLANGSYDVTDTNGNVIFKVKGHALSMHGRRELLDASGRTLVTLHQKVLSMHDRWRAFRGESTDERDLLFMAKRSKALQFNTKLHVYLGQNTNEDVWDYRVEGAWSGGSCVIYAGDTNDMVAQMNKKSTVKSALIGKDQFVVKVCPNIDYAFIVALVVILDGNNMETAAELKTCTALIKHIY